MFTPKRQQGKQTQSPLKSNATMDTGVGSTSSSVIFEKGTMLAELCQSNEQHQKHQLNCLATNAKNPNQLDLEIPEIVISSCQSHNNLNQSSQMQMQSQCDKQETNNSQQNTANSSQENATKAERTALLEQHHQQANDDDEPEEVDDDSGGSGSGNGSGCLASDALEDNDDFDEQFTLNRTTSDSNILESSIYSELQFAPSVASYNYSMAGQVLAGVCTASTPQHASAAEPTAHNPANPSSTPTTTVVDMLNLSACSRNTRSRKKLRRKQKLKSKCTNTVAPAELRPPVVGMHNGQAFTQQYVGPIYMETHYANRMAAAGHFVGNAATAATPFLNAPVHRDVRELLQQQHHHHQVQQQHHAQQQQLQHQHQLHQQQQHHQQHFPQQHLHHPHPPQHPQQQQFGYYPPQPRPIFNGGQFPHYQRQLQDLPNVRPVIGIPTSPPPVGRLNERILNESPGRFCGNPCKWFRRPSLPFVIGILALGGIACTLGGIVLGCTGLIEHSTQYLSAALLMIGIGVSLLVIGGAIWRLSLPDETERCHCYRHIEICRNCNNPYCHNNRFVQNSNGFMYPEFQHPTPPPSYVTSFNDCASMSVLLHPSAAMPQAALYANAMRVNTPPPVYRSTTNLGIYSSNNVSTISSSSNASQQNLNGTSSLSSIQQQHAHPQNPHMTYTTVPGHVNNSMPFHAVPKEFNYPELD